MTLKIGTDVYRVEEVYSWHAKMCVCTAQFAASIDDTYWEKLWDREHVAHKWQYRRIRLTNAPESAKQEERP